MTDPTDTISPATAAATAATDATASAPTGAVELIDDELLVEEISIDGMCGVY